MACGMHHGMWPLGSSHTNVRIEMRKSGGSETHRYFGALQKSNGKDFKFCVADDFVLCLKFKSRSEN